MQNIFSALLKHTSLAQFCHSVNKPLKRVKVLAWNPYSRGWISTVDLLALAISFKLLLKLKKNSFSFLQNKLS